MHLGILNEPHLDGIFSIIGKHNRIQFLNWDRLIVFRLKIRLNNLQHQLWIPTLVFEICLISGALLVSSGPISATSFNSDIALSLEESNTSD